MPTSITHFILADFGKLGTAFVETEPHTSLDTIIDRLGEYKVLGLFVADEAESTFRNITSDVVELLVRRGWDALSEGERDFVERHERRFNTAA